MGKAGAFQAVVPQVQAAQVGGTEVGIGEVDAGGVQVAQVEPTEITAAKVDGAVPGLLAVEAGDLFVMYQCIQRAVQLPWLTHETPPCLSLW
ncbi:hypothetical protein D3C75_1246290 [compost metagenome]